ncbi:hypothetical protein [Streptomyces sp. NPDC001389]|uniref:ATP-dependent DNA ligase n=1 Tax=unclassified Streptomyces TaxID=2593676 RepID=UPI0036979EFF
MFPRWTLLLSGRRVPRLLPLIPAWLTGIPLTMYRAVLTVMAVGVLPKIKPSPPFTTDSGITRMVEFGGVLVQDRWQNLVAAAEQLPACLLLDGELVVWDIEAGRLSFGALQRRATARARGAAALVAWWPAYFVAFDLLQQDGQELLTRPYADRRALLEAVFADHALTAPWPRPPQAPVRQVSASSVRPSAAFSTSAEAQISASTTLAAPIRSTFTAIVFDPFSLFFEAFAASRRRGYPWSSRVCQTASVRSAHESYGNFHCQSVRPD